MPGGYGQLEVFVFPLLAWVWTTESGKYTGETGYERGGGLCCGLYILLSLPLVVVECDVGQENFFTPELCDHVFVV